MCVCVRVHFCLQSHLCLFVLAFRLFRAESFVSYLSICDGVLVLFRGVGARLLPIRLLVPLLRALGLRACFES